MIGPFPNPPPEQRGRVRAVDHASRALRGNPWGDPSHRDVYVYTPQAYDAFPDRRYPVVLLLPGFAGTGEGMLSRGMTELSIAHRIDRLIAAGCPPFIAVMPDVMSRLGGTQFVDSPAIGNYATWLVDEVRPFVDGRFRTSARWAVAGKSSGGFGALHLVMAHPGVFSAAACHCGDMGFPLPYLGDLAPAVGALRGAGGPRAFVDAFWQKARFSGADFAALNLLCMAAAYSPLPADRVATADFPARLPVDLETGSVDFGVLDAWRVFDPVVRVEDAAQRAALAGLSLLWIDCGDQDEYQLHLGARQLSQRLTDHGVAHHHEEFPGGHRGTSHRYDASLPALVAALLGSEPDALA